MKPKEVENGLTKKRALQIGNLEKYHRFKAREQTEEQPLG